MKCKAIHQFLQCLKVKFPGTCTVFLIKMERHGRYQEYVVVADRGYPSGFLWVLNYKLEG